MGIKEYTSKKLPSMQSHHVTLWQVGRLSRWVTLQVCLDTHKNHLLNKLSLFAPRHYVRQRITAHAVSLVSWMHLLINWSYINSICDMWNYFDRYEICSQKSCSLCHFKIRENSTYELNRTLAWRTDSYFSLGILGFGLFVLLGITSLPSVSNALSWREFSFVQVIHRDDCGTPPSLESCSPINVRQDPFVVFTLWNPERFHTFQFPVMLPW